MTLLLIALAAEAAVLSLAARRAEGIRLRLRADPARR
jgi:hypothetical protein